MTTLWEYRRMSPERQLEFIRSKATKPKGKPMSDFPIDECKKTTDELMRRYGENFVFVQKFSCAQCGERQWVDEPLRYFERYRCGACGHDTDITVQGCNYTIMLGAGIASKERLAAFLKSKESSGKESSNA